MCDRQIQVLARREPPRLQRAHEEAGAAARGRARRGMID